MNKVLVEKIKESVQAVFPLTLVVLIVLVALGVGAKEIAMFALGAVMYGRISLFGIGANESMLFSWETGSHITEKKLFLLILLG